MSATPEVQPGTYDLHIIGIGNDGKQRSCECFVTVILTPAIANFTNPTDGGSVPQAMNIQGTTSGNLPEGRYMWVLVNQEGTPWWLPQTGRITPVNGQWSTSAQFGQPSTDNGTKYHVAAVLVNGTDDQYYQTYLAQSVQSGSYPNITPVNSAQIIKAITVTRT